MFSLSPVILRADEDFCGSADLRTRGVARVEVLSKEKAVTARTDA